MPIQYIQHNLYQNTTWLLHRNCQDVPKMHMELQRITTILKKKNTFGRLKQVFYSSIIHKSQSFIKTTQMYIK